MSQFANIFAASNCSLISQLLPPTMKKFLFDFMNGEAFRNPIAQVTGLLGDKIGSSIGRLEGLGTLNEDLRGLNTTLVNANKGLTDILAHTNRLSGLGSQQGLADLDQIIGVMSAYNSMRDLFRDPNQTLQDNFSNAFQSLNPNISGPFFENFGQNMNSIESLLSEIEFQIAMGGGFGPDGSPLADLSSFVGQIRQLTGNVNGIVGNITQLIENDNTVYALALLAVEKFALGNSIISSVLADPCYGGQLLTNLVTQPSFSEGLASISNENGGKIQSSPLDFLDFTPSLK